MEGLTGRKIGAFTIAGMLIISAMTGHISVCSASNSETDYIVKYKESAAWMSKERSVPFDVVSEGEMQRLNSAGLLEWYEPDGKMTLFDESAQSVYAEDKWDLALIHAEAALKNNYLGQNVRVGVLDSGINPHEDIAGRLVKGQSYIAGDSEDTADDYGHGTQVAGLIAGSGKNGCIGAAPEAELIPLKITDGNGVMVSTVCRAIYGGIDDYDCDILNLSLGIWSEYESLKEAVEYAEEKGVVVVASAGNKGTREKVYPAAYDSVIGVGAVDNAGAWFYHSNHNESVMITAPGVNVKTTGRYGGYELKSGTSFSAAYVSAAAAVILGKDNTLPPLKIREILVQTAADKGEAGRDEYYGAGILDIGGCVRYLNGGVCRLLPAEGAASQILNTADTDTDCIYFLVEYDDNGVCVKVTSHDIKIPANDTIEIEQPPENTNYGQFVLDKEMVMPLAIARKSH